MGSMLVVPFGRRRLLGVVVDVSEESELPLERLAEPIAALEADVPQSLVTLGLWVAREYVSTPARGLALVLPPGTGTGAGRPLRPKRSLRAAITPAGEAALSDGARMGARQRGALEALASAPLGAAALARRTGCSHATLRSLERRGLLRARERRRRTAPPAPRAGGGAGRHRRAHGGPGGGLRADRVPARAGGERLGRAPPAAPARGHRQRQDRGVPALGGRRTRARALVGGARPGDSAHSRRRRAASWSASATRWR